MLDSHSCTDIFGARNFHHVYLTVACRIKDEMIKGCFTIRSFELNDSLIIGSLHCSTVLIKSFDRRARC